MTLHAPRHRHRQGFTLLELLLVVAIIAMASAGVAFALRDAGQSRLDREAQRLAALLEGARAQSRSRGVTVRWRNAPPGFAFDGLPNDSALPTAWDYPETSAYSASPVVLGPEPIIGAQQIRLWQQNAPERSLWVSTDG
ncbi:MAG: prepilin-type N-terminal cleavage/methylation domain-containing protein, partial [Burkholderiaceae bacterium]|nr:prepilin-type N-terminal cleavage/methylation domain-containing protein [Burkholderiaceae bacterium]